MGIDYGMGKTNIGRDGIRYGILPPSMAPSWLSGEAQPVYPEGELEFECPNCGHSICGAGHDVCPECYECVEDARDMAEGIMGEAEPSGWAYEHAGVQLHRSQDDSDWWVMDSPYKVRGNYCSPCAPGAVYINGGGDDDWGFCIPPDWFDPAVLAGMANTPVLIAETEVGDD